MPAGRPGGPGGTGGGTSLSTFGVTTSDATVTVGPVEPTDQGALYDTPTDGSVWTDYKIENNYEDDRHTYMAGLTSSKPFEGKSAAFFQLAAPTLLWVARWTACRAESKPAIPDPFPSSASSRWTFLGRQLTPYMQTVMGDGKAPLWRISGVYYYGCVDPDDPPDDLLFFPIPPWLQDVNNRQVSDCDKQRHLIDDTPSGL